MSTDVTAEDAKLVTLARGARARAAAASAAAVRDETGRTHVGAAVDVPGLRMGAIELAVANAVASGASAIRGAAIVGEPVDVPEVLAHLAAPGAVLVVADAAGTVLAVRTP